mmetsp:Transcript_80059/g.214300  ORF Transcript_80059/g.214300 Transcript_80059/m.214300 type:complete len:96 (+) Transcript_80059:662-949(+)
MSFAYIDITHSCLSTHICICRHHVVKAQEQQTNRQLRAAGNYCMACFRTSESRRKLGTVGMKCEFTLQFQLLHDPLHMLILGFQSFWWVAHSHFR